MGRQAKNYLRYVQESTFGIVAASQHKIGVRFLQMRKSKDRFIACSASEDVLFWDLKTKQIINRLTNDSENTTEVSAIECHHGGHPRTNLIAVGYASGNVKVFEYETGTMKMSLNGHRTAVASLAFDKDGSRLASGGKDCTIVVWDLVSEKGLYSLKGHKNSISQVAFLYNDEYQKDLLVSTSIDPVSTIKFWDLQTQHCFRTISGNSSGVWSFALLRDNTRLVTGTSGPELKVYSIEFTTNEMSSAPDRDEELDPESEVPEDAISSGGDFGLQVKHLGNILRNSGSSTGRVDDLTVDQGESILICHSGDRTLEFYGIRAEAEALAFAKKSAKKQARKQAKRKRSEGGDQEEQADETQEEQIKIESIDDLMPQSIVDCEFNKKVGSIKLRERVKGIAVTKNGARKDSAGGYSAAIVFHTNRIEKCSIDTASIIEKKQIDTDTNISSLSHRHDVQDVAVSADNTLIMSASADTIKLWRLESRNCIATIDTEPVTCCCTFANAQNISGNYENRFGLSGTKKGQLQVFDTADSTVIETIQVCDSEKPLTSIFTLPDRTGIVCGGEDGFVRFFNYTWRTKDEDGQRRAMLTLKADRNMSFGEGITNVQVSGNGKLLAVALLDSTVRVHFVDTFKYFLTLYGHKFPVTTMDISEDNTLLITGSPDKNIKIWGLDFGDCHKSIFAHDDAITRVRFVPKTHYAFSCARDKTIKHWDCDHFIKIQTLRRHQGAVNCLAVSPNGKYVVTGSHDKSLRLYRKTEEILVPEEEDETEREIQDERDVFEKQENIVVGEVNLESGFANKMTIETVKTTDRLIEAIDVFEAEQLKHIDYVQQCRIARSKGEPEPPEPERDPLLMTALTTDYNRFMLEILRRIRPSDLEEVLITLPFDYVRRLLSILVLFLKKNWDVELMMRCSTFLLRTNFGQIAACPTLVPVVAQLRKVVMKRAEHLRDCAGFNLIALEHITTNREYAGTKIQ